MENKYQRLTINKLSKLTGISRITLMTWRELGWLRPSCRIGSRFLYSWEDFRRAEKLSLINGGYYDTKSTWIKNLTTFLKFLLTNERIKMLNEDLIKILTKIKEILDLTNQHLGENFAERIRNSEPTTDFLGKLLDIKKQIWNLQSLIKNSNKPLYYD